jgi:hypothetical protein
MSAQPGASVRVQVGVAVDYQQGHSGQAVQHRVQRRQLTQVELARPVGLDFGHQLNSIGDHVGEGSVSGCDGRCPGASRGQVMHIRRHE